MNNLPPNIVKQLNKTQEPYKQRCSSIKLQYDRTEKITSEKKEAEKKINEIENKN